MKRMAWVLAAVMIVGCSGIRVIRINRQGGEIALIGNREDAMEKARLEMARTCGSPDAYEIVEEGEAVVGTVSTTNTYGNTGNSETHEKTEWRVRFSCKGAAAPPPPVAPPPPQGRAIHEVRIAM